MLYMRNAQQLDLTQSLESDSKSDYYIWGFDKIHKGNKKILIHSYSLYRFDMCAYGPI